MCACESLYIPTIQLCTARNNGEERIGYGGGNHISVTAARRIERPATSSDADNNNRLGDDGEGVGFPNGPEYEFILVYLITPLIRDRILCVRSGRGFYTV